MKTPQTERGHIVEAFTRIALANPSVHMSLTHNGKAQFDLPATENWAERIGTFFGHMFIPVSEKRKSDQRLPARHMPV